MKILIVEDERSLAGILQKGLKKLGFAVDTAFDGEEAGPSQIPCKHH